MKKIVTLLAALLSLCVITGCEGPESKGSVSGIKIFLNGKDISGGITIEQGQTVTVTADAGVDPKYAFIVWENQGAAKDKIEIVSAGHGPECTLKGKETGNAGIIVKAWRSGETPKELELPVEVIPAEVKDIRIAVAKIGIGEKRPLEAEIMPAWAANIVAEWSAAPSGIVNLEETDGIWAIEGLVAGSVTLTVTAGGFTTTIPLSVAEPEHLTGLAIYLDGEIVTGTTVPIGVFQEKFLEARAVPDGAFTFFEWKTDSPAVTVDSDGIIKGIEADSSATITVTASGKEASIIVQVANPVQGIRIKYDNTDGLSVANVIWLYPGDSVELKADLMPAGIEGEIVWALVDGLSVVPDNNGRTCTITGDDYDLFESPPLIVRVTARNDGNGNRPATADILVKVLENEPIWAWDRARDADLNESLKIFGEELTPTAPFPASVEAAPGLPGYRAGDPPNTAWNLQGRGTLADVMQHTIKRVKVPYTPLGLNMCSARGNPAYDANSCIWVLGTNYNTDTSSTLHVPGVFNFYTEDVYEGGVLLPDRPISRQIRVSVDFEVISSTGRQLGIHINNTTSTNANSQLSTSNRLAYRAINEAKGTKITYPTYLDAAALIAESNPAINAETLKDATVNIITYSDGANILVSGIRIEYE